MTNYEKIMSDMTVKFDEEKNLTANVVGSIAMENHPKCAKRL